MSTGTVRISEGSLRFQDGDNVADRLEGHLRYHFSRRLFVQDVEPDDDGYLITVGIVYPRDVSDCRVKDNVLKMVNIGDIDTLYATPMEGDYYKIDLPSRSDLYAAFKDRHEDILAHLDTSMARAIFERVYKLPPVRNQLNSVIEIVDYVREDAPISISRIEDAQTTGNTRKYISALEDHGFFRVDEDEMVYHGSKIEATDIKGLSPDDYERKVVGMIIDDAYYTLRRKLGLGMLNHFPKFANAYYLSAFRRGKRDLWLTLEDIQENLVTEYNDTETDILKTRRRLRSLDSAGVLRFEDDEVTGRKEIFNEVGAELPSVG